MPAIKPIVLNNVFGQGKDLTLSPKSVVGQKSEFEDRTAGVNVGFHRFSLVTVNMPNARKVTANVRINYLKQVEGSANGYAPAPALDRFDELEVTFKTNNRGSVSERTALVAALSALLENVDLRSVVIDGEEIY